MKHHYNTPGPDHADDRRGGWKIIVRSLWYLGRRPLYVGLLAAIVLTACTPALDVRLQQEPEASAAVSEEVGGETEVGEAFGAGSLEQTLELLVTYLAVFAELCGVIVIGVGVVRGLFRFVPHIFRRQPAGDLYSEDIRLQLGKSLALALEFALAADILKTAVAPTLGEIGLLAAIAFLRTFLNYFLERELRQAQERELRQVQGHGGGTLGAGPGGAAPEPPGSERPPSA